MDKIGERIKQRREELGMTQQELATKLGFNSKTTIAKVENGSRNVAESKIAAYAEALDTTKNWLKGKKGPEPEFAKQKIEDSIKLSYKIISESMELQELIEIYGALDASGKAKVMSYARMVKEGTL